MPDDAAPLLSLLNKARCHVDNTRDSVSNGEAETSLALASCFLDAMGHIVIGWLLLEQAVTAYRFLESDTGRYDKHFLQGKVHVCRYFIQQELPIAAAWLENASRSPEPLTGLAEEGF